MRNILFFIRLIKGLFVRFKLHAVFGPFEWLLDNLLYLTRFSKWKNSLPVLPFNDFFNNKVDYNNRYKLYEYILKSEELGKEINYIEFGVAQGHSFKWWMQNNKDPQTRFYGFDTFTGLPEDWNFLFKKGSMSDSGKIPEVIDPRGELFPGLFQDTLPGFLKKLDNSKRNVIHLDADLYTSTLYVLTTMAPFIKKDDILLFDEFFVPTHEFKAFTEFISAFYFKYEVIGAINNFLQTAIKITGK